MLSGTRRRCKPIGGKTRACAISVQLMERRNLLKKRGKEEKKIESGKYSPNLLVMDVFLPKTKATDHRLDTYSKDMSSTAHICVREPPFPFTSSIFS